MLQVLPDVSEEEVARVFTALDVDRTGSIDLRVRGVGLGGWRGTGGLLGAVPAT